VNAVEFQGVSKSYAIYDAPGDRLKELLTLNRVKRHRDFWALREVSFQVKRGETFCIVGENGSGKSTLLQMVAGILHPTSGTVGIDGRVSALLELGAGFNAEFSGRDNVYLNGSILGLTTRQIDQRYSDIAAFAEIGSFLDQPVKTYSSGMVVRLAFAVAINVDAPKTVNHYQFFGWRCTQGAAQGSVEVIVQIGSRTGTSTYELTRGVNMLDLGGGSSDCSGNRTGEVWPFTTNC
jgi:ABC-type polysaccharide/polyol phosphate transport system ATPase subunit